MRVAAFAILAAVTVSACGQGGSGGGDSAPASSIFPNLFQTAYRTEANIRNPQTGEMSPIVMIRDGQKMRMEINSPEGQMVIISNGDTGESLIISQAQGRQFAMRQTDTGVESPEEAWGAELAATATFAGPCVHIGETGAEWRRTDEQGENATCVTGDGIILWSALNGDRTWEATSVSRGPQPAELFAAPPGVEVMDLGNMSDMIDRARANAGQ
jgi:hypothetical protein